MERTWRETGIRQQFWQRKKVRKRVSKRVLVKRERRSDRKERNRLVCCCFFLQLLPTSTQFPAGARLFHPSASAAQWRHRWYGFGFLSPCLCSWRAVFLRRGEVSSPACLSRSFFLSLSSWSVAAASLFSPAAFFSSLILFFRRFFFSLSFVVSIPAPFILSLRFSFLSLRFPSPSFLSLRFPSYPSRPILSSLSRVLFFLFSSSSLYLLLLVCLSAFLLCLSLNVSSLSSSFSHNYFFLSFPCLFCSSCSLASLFIGLSRSFCEAAFLLACLDSACTLSESNRSFHHVNGHKERSRREGKEMCETEATQLAPQQAAR